MKQWQSTASYLSSKLPQHIFQVLPYSNTADLKTDLRKNKLDFLLTANNEVSQFVAEFAVAVAAVLQSPARAVQLFPAAALQDDSVLVQ